MQKMKIVKAVFGAQMFMYLNKMEEFKWQGNISEKS